MKNKELVLDSKLSFGGRLFTVLAVVAIMAAGGLFIPNLADNTFIGGAVLSLIIVFCGGYWLTEWIFMIVTTIVVLLFAFIDWIFTGNCWEDIETLVSFFWNKNKQFRQFCAYSYLYAFGDWRKNENLH